MYSISHLHAGGHPFEPGRLQLRNSTRHHQGTSKLIFQLTHLSIHLVTVLHIVHRNSVAFFCEQLEINGPFFNQCQKSNIFSIHEQKQYLHVIYQGRSHTFESEGAKSTKAIFGPFCLKKWEGPSLLLLLYGQKSGGAQAPRAP